MKSYFICFSIWLLSESISWLYLKVKKGQRNPRLGQEKAWRCPELFKASGCGFSVGRGPPTCRMSAQLGFQGDTFLHQAPGEPSHTVLSLWRSNLWEASAGPGQGQECREGAQGVLHLSFCCAE